MARYGKPEIINTDQGSQFTGLEFISNRPLCTALRIGPVTCDLCP